MTNQDLLEIQEEMNGVVWYDAPSESDYELIIDNNDLYVETGNGKHPVAMEIMKKRKWQRIDWRIEQRDYTWWCCTCTIVSALIAAWNYIGREFTKQEVEDCIQYCVNNWGYKIWRGRSTGTAMKYVRKYLLTLWVDLTYAFLVLKETDKLSEVANTAFNNNLMCRMSHSTSPEMTKDRYDWILNGNNFRKVWGHSTNIIKKGNEYRVFWSSIREDYLLEKWEQQIVELIDNGVIRNFSYVRLDVKDIPQNSESDNALDTMKLHWITKLSVDDFKNTRDRPITRKEMIMMLYRFLKLIIKMFLEKPKDGKTKPERILEEIEKIEKI